MTQSALEQANEHIEAMKSELQSIRELCAGAACSEPPAEVTEPTLCMVEELRQRGVCLLENGDHFETLELIKTALRHAYARITELEQAAAKQRLVRVMRRVRPEIEIDPDDGSHMLCAICEGCTECSGACGRPVCAGLCIPGAETSPPAELQAATATPPDELPIGERVVLTSSGHLGRVVAIERTPYYVVGDHQGKQERYLLYQLAVDIGCHACGARPGVACVQSIPHSRNLKS